MDSIYLKPMVAAACSVVLDQYVIGEKNYMKNAYFGAAVLAGSVVGQMLAPSINILGELPSINESLYDGSTLAKRIEELGVSTASVYMLNRYVLNNDVYSGEFGKRIGIIVASSVVAEYFSDYMNSRPMAYLTDE